MTSCNSYDGVARVANYHVLTEILRNEWGYKYFTMSDASGTDRLCDQFKMCKSNPVDMEAIVNYSSRRKRCRDGRWILQLHPDSQAKFTCGLFENPYLGDPATETPKHHPHQGECCSCSPD
ncbi:hypothetical protein VC83_08262 [Pseudogymnoascus destructans]|uniref:Uncharacterized protein n=1 Tax=Pseudogymnoascus destructans TaxID=655981 RepID=A0A177A3C0_9PEZI|nr:uncharacterized protein VC83_08262 [Pseudogymnoascus destructans]OAF55434.1 hypothetical protein VC83_08262 [Pseudogymnoascus destructans]